MLRERLKRDADRGTNVARMAYTSVSVGSNPTHVYSIRRAIGNELGRETLSCLLYAASPFNPPALDSEGNELGLSAKLIASVVWTGYHRSMRPDQTS